MSSQIFFFFLEPIHSLSFSSSLFSLSTLLFPSSQNTQNFQQSSFAQVFSTQFFAMPTCRRRRGGGEGGEAVREAWRQQQLWWQRWRCCDFLSLGENGGWVWGHQESSLLFVFRAEYKQRVSLELKCCCFEIHWPWPPWQKINDMQNHQLIKTPFSSNKNLKLDAPFKIWSS